jgi:hypothetical protein
LLLVWLGVVTRVCVHVVDERSLASQKQVWLGVLTRVCVHVVDDRSIWHSPSKSFCAPDGVC